MSGASLITVRGIPLSVAAEAAPILSPDEQRSAAAFHREADRRQYAACRTALRVHLGRLLNVAPASLQFAYGEFEKPFLVGEALGFNVSHAGGLLLIATARGRNVGVDVERLRQDLALEDLKEQLAPADRKILESAPEVDRARCFLRLWTRREALVKATGEGLTLPFSDGDGEREGYGVVELDVGAGFVAALAADGGPVEFALEMDAAI